MESATVLARCWRDSQGVFNSLLILSIGAPGKSTPRFEHPYRAELDSEHSVEARAQDSRCPLLGHHPPSRIPSFLNVHCYVFTSINRSESVLSATSALHLGLHWTPKVVILQGRGAKNHYFHFFHSSHHRNSIFDRFWTPWGLVLGARQGSFSLPHGRTES